MIAWILISDASRARLFETDAVRHDHLKLIRELSHPESRARGAELVTDRPGRMSKQRASLPIDAASQPRRTEAQRFAKSLAEVLQEGADRNAYSALGIVAPPHFLGLLRDTVSPGVRK